VFFAQYFKAVVVGAKEQLTLTMALNYRESYIVSGVLIQNIGDSSTHKKSFEKT